MSIQPLGIGQYRLRETITISNQADVEVSLGTSPAVKVVVDQLVPSTDTRLCFLQFSDDNRATYENVAAYSHRIDISDSSGTTINSFNNTSDGVVRIMNGSRLGNAAGENFNYIIDIMGHTNSSSATSLYFLGFGVDNNGNSSRLEGSAKCIYNSSQNIATDMRLYVDSGNLASGNIYVYELIS